MCKTVNTRPQTSEDLGMSPTRNRASVTLLYTLDRDNLFYYNSILPIL